MGSEGPATVFHVTGFKKFQGVPVNPTETIAMELPTYLEKNGSLPAGACLGSCTILETAAQGAVSQLIQLLERPFKGEGLVGKEAGGLSLVVGEKGGSDKERKEESGGVGEDKQKGEENSAKRLGDVETIVGGGPVVPLKGSRVVWVHFGVNSGAYKFAIERRAVNEATFRCADEMGWQPQREMIVKEDGHVGFVRKTTLPTGWIAEQLRAKGFDVTLSDDAGRFVCNYVYYQSLRHAALVSGATCIFVHVPSFHVIEEATQVRFAAALLEVLAAC